MPANPPNIICLATFFKGGDFMRECKTAGCNVILVTKEKMLQEDKYCVDVLRQTMAIEKAMQRLDELILEGHLETCVADSFREGRSKAAVGELVEIFRTSRG